MITSFFITLGTILFSGFNLVLPASEALPSAISDALNYVGDAVNSISYLVPVGSLFGALAIVIGYEAATWIFHGIQWIWKKIPILGK